MNKKRSYCQERCHVSIVFGYRVYCIPRVLYRCTDVIEYLLEKTSGGASKVELGNNEGRTLLHIAALANNRQLVTYLLDNHHASKTSVWTHKVSNSATSAAAVQTLFSVARCSIVNNSSINRRRK